MTEMIALIGKTRVEVERKTEKHRGGKNEMCSGGVCNAV